MLKRLNPLTVLAVCLVWILATTLVFRAPFQLAAILLFAAMLLASRAVSPLAFLGLMVPFALFGFGFFTTNVLFRQENAAAVAVFSADLARSDALGAGLVLFLRALAGGTISIFFAFSIDPGALVRAAMAYGRLPPRIAYSLFAAMQIVPDLAAKANQLRLAEAMRRGRGLRRVPGPGELFRLLIPLIAFAIRRAGRTAIAMEARGFDAGRARTILDVPGFCRRDAAFAAVLAACLALCLAL
ncbi:energy-coupling factor transporter transmembrane component T family protein [Aureimonas populi]|uniref:Energy-coupling factor transporter transmembrane component T family protein n=1 Tax=Aureimonas populi TaxID=1701758 RepID=A0ABW5CP96_9HYPH|nr:energy-coupling factor transporter transmembrane component T [Aureimonas populi]